MRAYVAACVIGLFAVDEKGNLLARRLFQKEPTKIAEALANFASGKRFNELEGLIGELRKKGYEDVSTSQPNKATEFVRENFRKLAIELKFVKNQAELNNLLSAVGVASSKAAITKVGRRDKLIIQAVSAFNDLDRILNLMSERIREWYGLHYPEFRPAEHEKFIEAIVKYGNREKFEKFTTSMGMQLVAEDIAILQRYAARLKELYVLRSELEKYLNALVPTEMPNMSALLGPILAARLLAQAGSLEKLAKMPSSTVQLLGAEKALFKALRTKGKEVKVPKFGILFTHPDISSAPKEQQGKIARLLAAKVSIAARTDFYTKEDRSKELIEDYRRKLEEARKAG
ncbi:MAG: hypothetical protein QW751_02975 [Candidatus Aenigmatarchaeota archaeon]|nr:hypothetical protein [Candidatus Aenigmarchaeota archaeon]